MILPVSSTARSMETGSAAYLAPAPTHHRGQATVCSGYPPSPPDCRCWREFSAMALRRYPTDKDPIRRVPRAIHLAKRLRERPRNSRRPAGVLHPCRSRSLNPRSRQPCFRRRQPRSHGLHIPDANLSLQGEARVLQAPTPIPNTHPSTHRRPSSRELRLQPPPFVCSYMHTHTITIADADFGTLSTARAPPKRTVFRDDDGPDVTLLLAVD